MRKSVGFVVAHVADRRLQQLSQRQLAVHRVHLPRAVLLAPIERSLPAFGLDRVPSRGKPELRTPVAAIFDEVQVLRTGNQPRRQRKRTQVFRMAGQLVIEGEPLAGKSDLAQAALVFNPIRLAQRWRVEDHRFVQIRRTKRVGPQRVLDIVGQQFLVLLLVVEAEHDPPHHFLLRRLRGQQSLDAFLHMLRGTGRSSPPAAARRRHAASSPAGRRPSCNSC